MTNSYTQRLKETIANVFPLSSLEMGKKGLKREASKKMISEDKVRNILAFSKAYTAFQLKQTSVEIDGMISN